MRLEFFLLSLILLAFPEVSQSQDFSGIIKVSGERTVYEKNKKVVKKVIPFTSTYQICEDTIFVNWLYDENIDHELSMMGFQVNKSCYLYNKNMPESFFEMRMIPPEINKFTKKHWKKYTKNGYSHRAKDSSIPEYQMEYRASIDKSISYNQQFKMQGYFPHVFTAFGKLKRLERIEPDVKMTYTFEYSPDPSLSCHNLIPDTDKVNQKTASLVDFTNHDDIIEKQNRKSLRVFLVKDLTDKIRSSNDLFLEQSNKSRFTYIDIWATTCAPCIKELDEIKKLRTHFPEEELRIVSLSIDNERDFSIWQNSIMNNYSEWEHYFIEDGMNSSIVEDYKIFIIPRYLILDKEGKILNERAYRPSDQKLIPFLKNLMRISE